MYLVKYMLSILFISACMLSTGYGQVYGKIMSKEEANTRFGPVLTDVQLETELLNEFIEQNADVLMFNIIEGNPVILDKHRKLLYSHSNISISPAQVFYKYSISVIRDLLISGGSSTTSLEKRADVLTITNGLQTMEFGGICPPFCEDE